MQNPNQPYDPNDPRFQRMGPPQQPMGPRQGRPGFQGPPQQGHPQQGHPQQGRPIPPWMRLGEAFQRYMEDLQVTEAGRAVMERPVSGEEVLEILTYFAQRDMAPMNLDFSSYMVLKSNLALMDQNEELRKYLARIEDHLGALRRIQGRAHKGAVQTTGPDDVVPGPSMEGAPQGQPQGQGMPQGHPGAYPPQQAPAAVEVTDQFGNPLDPSDPDDAATIALAQKLGDPATAFADMPGGASGGTEASPTQMPPEVQAAMEQAQVQQQAQQQAQQGVQPAGQPEPPPPADVPDNGQGETAEGGELVDDGGGSGAEEAPASK